MENVVSTHDYVNVNNVPFEQRCPPRRRKRERLTRTDRFVCVFCGLFLGRVLWTDGYLILVGSASKAASRRSLEAQAAADFNPLGRLPSYWWGCPLALAFGLFGGVVGAERMMDGFETGAKLLAKVARIVERS